MTVTAAPITFSFDEGIDRKALRRLRERFAGVNDSRWERACSMLGHRQQRVLEVLPLVFHLNHPALPGYLDAGCPQGLAHYRPSERALSAASRLARSFSPRGAGRGAVRGQPDLTALFLMGSPGSVGYSTASDLDVWLCHRDDLSEAGVVQLEGKAKRVSAWAAEFGLELHVFVFSATDWRFRQQRAEVNGENCGSAQHDLLLDEFYRTGIHLAGCYPLWWLVPADEEDHYAERARQLVEQRFIRGEETIDFGAVPRIPAGEFLGAGVWQLYKGIDSPWKSLLKLVLIECYARDSGNEPLALAYKRAVHAGETDPDRLDPYVMLYQRVADWLQRNDAGERLALFQRSFYLKAGLPLSRTDGSGLRWRMRLLDSLVQSWGWSLRELRWLDNRQGWRAEEVVELRRAVVAELTHSYRFLSRLARHHGVQAAISPADMSLLGRKLYASFQRKAGKLELINPNLVPSLLEENLAFYHQSTQTGDEQARGWLLYRDLENPADALWQPVIRRAGNLTELVTWCHYNGLLGPATRLNLRAGASPLSMAELRELIESVQHSLPASPGPVSREALLAPARALKQILFVNVAVDPQAHLTERGLHKLSARHDSLRFSGGRDNLIQTIDQVTVNSWHEVCLQHYAAGDTLVQCLKNVLADIALNPSQPPVLRVHAPGHGHGATIARRVQELFSDLQTHFFAGGTGPHPMRYVLEMDRRFFVLQFSDSQPGFVELGSRAALLEYLRKAQSEYAPVVFDRHALLDDPALRAACHASQPGRVQIFYQVQGERAGFWVVDELGSVVTWQQPVDRRRQLLVPLVRFLDNLMERRALSQTLTTPSSALDLECSELVADAGSLRPERRPLPGDERLLPGFEVQAVGVQSGTGGLAFDLFCGEHEFLVQEYGDQLIPAVAHFIRSRRPSGGRYPVYLTDLHLPHDLDPNGYRHQVQAIDYLYYRRALEQALNQALAAG